MRLLLSLLASMNLAACAGQAPSQQLTAKDKVRVCQGNVCTDQSADTVTFQADPVDVEAERRLQALTDVAQKSPQAAYDLGLRLLRGDGVAKDSYQAIEWLRKAGDQGLVNAQLALGRLYLAGVEEMGSDPAEAQSWLSRAASQGNQEAQRLLPQSQAAKQDAQSLYQAQESARKSWQAWYSAAPYYWYWAPSGWRLR